MVDTKEQCNADIIYGKQKVSLQTTAEAFRSIPSRAKLSTSDTTTELRIVLNKLTKMGGEVGGAVAGGLCMLAVLSAIPITMIVLGANHMDDCPMEPWIPKCMVIGGAATLALFVIIIVMLVCGAMENTGAVLCGTVLCGIIGLFLCAWNIASSYWVFKEWQGWGNVKNDIKKGCHKETYLFIFSILIIYWITVPCQGGGAKKGRNDQA